MRTFPRSVVSISVFTVKAAIVLVAGLMLVAGASWWIIAPLAKQNSQQQIFTMQGEAKRFVTPDTAVVLVGNELRGANPAELQRKAEESVAKARTQLIAAGIAQESIRTNQYNLSPAYDTLSGVRTLKEYVMTIELEVRTTKLDLVGKVIDIAVANELNRIGGVQYSVENKAQIEDELRKEAIANATAEAKSVAKSSGLRLGKVLNVVDGYYYSPVYYGDKGVSVTDSSGAPSRPSVTPTPSTTVNPGQTQMQMTVTVYFEVK